MKLAGALIIIVCSVVFGLSLSALSSDACAAAEELYRAMKYVRDEICENRTPTDIILSRLPALFGGADAGADSVYNAYGAALSKLGEAERRVFRQFCDVMGKGDAEIQRGAFDALLSQYETHLNARRQKNKNAPKLYTASALFIGISAVIIFL